MEFIGTLRLDGKVDITDPCYDKGTWCRMTTECKAGEYYGYAEVADCGEWGQRVKSISIYKDDVKCSLGYMVHIGSIGVDAGLAGFFNDKPDFSDDEWYKFLNKYVDFEEKTYSCDYGVFSESGYGDGGYEVFANVERTAFTIIFIDDEEEDIDL